MANAEASGSAQGGEAQGGAHRIPPYISFQTLLTFLSELKTNGMPPQIDKSVLRRFSGGVQGQLKMGIRSLGLIDGDAPTDRLKAMVDAHETPAFDPLLLDILKDVYPYVFALDLQTATPTMFADAFKVTGAKEDVSRKCRTFFLHAAKKAGVQLGTRILTGSVPRGPANGTSRRKAKAAKPEDDSGKRDQPPPFDQAGKPPAVQKALEYQLIDLMTEPDIVDEVKQSIWSLVQYLTARKAKQASVAKPTDA